jgi:alpha-D-ribose 1-methylphosphonate 5-phosphate C-P lyase
MGSIPPVKIRPPHFAMANVKTSERQGRVIRRYRSRIPIAEFDRYSELIRSKAGLWPLRALRPQETDIRKSRNKKHSIQGSLPH